VKRPAWIALAVLAAGLIVWLAIDTGRDQGETTAPTARADAPGAGALPDASPQIEAQNLPAPADVAKTLVAPPDSESIEGVVRRASDHSPLHGCDVRLLVFDERLHEKAILAEQNTQEDGSFRFGAGVAAHDPLWIEVTWTNGSMEDEWWRAPRDVFKELHSAPRSVDSGETELPPRGDRRSLSFELETGWLARGRVVDAEGHAVEGKPAARYRDMSFDDPDARYAAFVETPGAIADVDRDGGFVLYDIDPLVAEAHLTIGAQGHDRREVVVKRSKGAQLVDLGEVMAGPRTPVAPSQPNVQGDR
jgi:hypothetical protein